MDRMRAALHGVVCATLTPFEADGRTIIWSGVQSNARWLADHRVSALVVNGSIGEYVAVEPAERARLVTETVAAVAGDIPVIAGCSHNSLTEAVRLCREAQEAGVTGVMLLPPSYFRLSGEEIVRFFTAIDAAVELPFLVYNNPGTARMDIPYDALAELARLEHFGGLKEANPNALRFYDLVERFGERMPVVAASEPSLFAMLAIGSPGCLTATAAFAPDLLDDLMRAFAREDLTGARAIFRGIRAFRALFQPLMDRGYPAYIPYTKAAMDIVGLVGGSPAFPLSPLGDAERDLMRRVLHVDMGLELDHIDPIGDPA
jgi:4-hydroxy-tetrahydrodipicolinate synthase